MTTKHHIIKTKDEYRESVTRASRLRDTGAKAETNDELAALEGAIARYALIPGQPAKRKGRPPES